MVERVHIPGLVLTEHDFQVPLDYARPDGPRITVFAREAAAPDGLDRPFLLYLEGGPGQESPRPTGPALAPPWLERALRDFRVLFLDQRGTGRSTPVGTLTGWTARQQADYLMHFRADSIVRDAEFIRAELGVESWSLLGQSFGGFCTLHYLSTAPEAVREAFFTGGLPPVGLHPDEVYTATFANMLERNRRYYLRYPGDRERVRALHATLERDQVLLPDGSPLTSRKLRHVGNHLGMTVGAERLHYMFERDPRSPAFAFDVAAALPFSARNPLYAVIHESSYSDGFATRWSAARTLPAEFDEDRTLFTGEHIFPWTCAEIPGLDALAEAADLLAEHQWPRLYDEQRLRACTVPCAAAIYAEDAFVDRALSERTAALLPGMRTWITNEYEHDGLRMSGGRVLDRLIALARYRA